MSEHDLWLENQLVKFNNKKLLRPYYANIFSKISHNLSMVSGENLEIGTGTAISKEFLTGISYKTSDAIETRFSDQIIDAQKLPFKPNSFANIFGVDVLHHLSRPFDFFKEAERVLHAGGKVVLVEPAITPFSWFIYRYFHGEEMKWNVRIGTNVDFSGPHVMDANNAIPSKIFGNEVRGDLSQFGIKLDYRTFLFSGLSMLITGGINSKFYLPVSVKALKKIIMYEERIPRFIKKIFFLRILIILEAK